MFFTVPPVGPVIREPPRDALVSDMDTTDTSDIALKLMSDTPVPPPGVGLLDEFPSMPPPATPVNDTFDVPVTFDRLRNMAPYPVVRSPAVYAFAASFTVPWNS